MQFVLGDDDPQQRRSKPIVMGILNATPDSFFDGGRFVQRTHAIDHVMEMIEAGAGIIDVGGESTRPGAEAVGLDEELERVIPLIEAIRSESDIPVSVDTNKPAVMREAVAAGANFINDVCALQEEGAITTAVELEVPVCLMHMQGQPRMMQQRPHYDDVVAEVMAFLQSRSQACIAAGMRPEKIVIDPGFGFGKSLQHNLLLFQNLEQFHQLGFPLLVGVSRKSMIGAVLDIPVEERMVASAALAGLAVWLGACIVRAHDVQATVQAVKMCQAVRDIKRGD